jgi:hypothetical protein
MSKCEPLHKMILKKSLYFACHSKKIIYFCVVIQLKTFKMSQAVINHKLEFTFVDNKPIYYNWIQKAK